MVKLSGNDPQNPPPKPPAPKRKVPRSPITTPPASSFPGLAAPPQSSWHPNPPTQPIPYVDTAPVWPMPGQDRPVSVVNSAGGQGFKRDPRSELFVAAVSTMYGEPNFYESADARALRLRQLVGEVLHTSYIADMDDLQPHVSTASLEATSAITEASAVWLSSMIVWLRTTAQIRTTSLVLAAEYAIQGGPAPRSLIARVCQRADEPAELLSYWQSRTGKKAPHGGLQRGLADAAARLYDEYAVMKYGQGQATRKSSSSTRSMIPADVVALTHPKPTSHEQSDLFKFMVDVRQDRGATDSAAAPIIDPPESLRRIHLRAKLLKTPQDHLRKMARYEPEGFAEIVNKSGVTWEALSQPYGELDAAFWEALIPSLGYMALLRNLNNFDKTGISPASQSLVRQILVDPARVAKSRQFPYRFYSAYRNRVTDNYARELSTAADLSVANIPALGEYPSPRAKSGDGTLILVDASGSMTSNYVSKPRDRHPSSRSFAGQAHGTHYRKPPTAADVAVLFGLALHLRNYDSSDLYLFDHRLFKVTPPRGTSLLKGVDEIVRRQFGGGATHTWSALQVALDQTRHSRVVILSDMQTQETYDPSYAPPGRSSHAWSYGFGQQLFDDSSRSSRYSDSHSNKYNKSAADVPVPVYTFNFSGYDTTYAALGENFVELGGGFSDAAFRVLSTLESGQDTSWPWQDSTP